MPQFLPRGKSPRRLRTPNLHVYISLFIWRCYLSLLSVIYASFTLACYSSFSLSHQSAVWISVTNLWASAGVGMGAIVPRENVVKCFVN